MYFCVVFVLRSATQRKTNAAGEIKRKSSVFTNNSANISLRLFYNSLPLPRMCYVLVSNGWLDSRSNSNICKSACAGERHVFGIWGIGQFHHPYSRQWHCEKLAFGLRLAVHEMFIVIIKANTIHDIIKLIV